MPESIIHYQDNLVTPFLAWKSKSSWPKSRSWLNWQSKKINVDLSDLWQINLLRWWHEWLVSLVLGETETSTQLPLLSSLCCHLVFLIKYLKHLRGFEENYFPAIESSNISKKKHYEIYPHMCLSTYLHLCSLPNFKQTLTYLPVWSESYLLRVLIGLTPFAAWNACYQNTRFIFWNMRKGRKSLRPLWVHTLTHLSVKCMKWPEAAMPQSQSVFYLIYVAAVVTSMKDEAILFFL